MSSAPIEPADAAPNNLPVQATPFVGRERLLDALTSRLRRADVRLLTLTGPGGTGKTRLALQGAGDLLDSFPDGVFFVPLTPLSDPSLVASAIAQTLQIKPVARRPRLETLKDFLRGKRLLLVLDNFEQLLASASQEAVTTVAALLEAAIQLKVLVTSRAPLRLYGEHELPVPPLALPDRRTAPSAAHVRQFEAVKLFVQRAQAAHADFTVTDENAEAVAEICRRVDGLPLAIELAAARMRALPLVGLLDRLERRLPILTGGPRDVPARQQTLRSTIAWSYDLLTPEEQTLFRRLGVFRGATLEAMEEICCVAAGGARSTSIAIAALGLDPLDGVTSLAEKSLLHQEETEDGQPWYVMLETVREFALERLAEAGEAPALRRRHTLYYLRLVEAMEADIQGPNQVQFMERLEREHDNFRDALNWCQETGYAEPSLRIALALWWFWYVRGHAAEGRARLAALLDRFPEETTTGSRGLIRARALVAAGRLASLQGEQAESHRFQEQALRVLEEHGDLAGSYATLQSLAFAAGQQGDFDVARAYLEKSIGVARELGDPRAVANALTNLGNVALDSGDHERARRVLAEGLAIFEEVGELRGTGNACSTLAVAELEAGNLARARTYAQKTVDVYERAGDVRGRAVGLVNLASVEAEQGDVAEAHRHLIESLRIHQDVGDRSGVAGVLDRLATLAAMRGHAVYAMRAAGAAAAQREALGEFVPERVLRKLDQKLAPAREALGAGAADAFAAGRSLSLEQAIAEALVFDPEAAPVTPSPAAGTATPVAPDASVGVLSPREREVAALIARGYTNKQIARELTITEGTAASHVVHILDKLGFSSRAQVAAWATEQGLFRSPAA